eukprot:7192464-Heterocapsa_arctica.AAC.1
MTIQPFTKYLGTFLGPAVGDRPWRAPAVKRVSRSIAVAGTGAPPSIAIGHYNKYVLPTLGYVAQLGLPPKSLLALELGQLTRILHSPPQSFSLSDVMNFHLYGLPR